MLEITEITLVLKVSYKPRFTLSNSNMFNFFKIVLDGQIKSCTHTV